MITTRALAAHHRLLVAGLPSQRHEWRPRVVPLAPKAQGERPKRDNSRLLALRAEALERREEVRQLRKRMSFRAMARELGVSRTTIANHVRAIKAERRRRR